MHKINTTKSTFFLCTVSPCTVTSMEKKERRIPLSPDVNTHFIMLQQIHSFTTIPLIYNLDVHDDNCIGNSNALFFLRFIFVESHTIISFLFFIFSSQKTRLFYFSKYLFVMRYNKMFRKTKCECERKYGKRKQKRCLCVLCTTKYNAIYI